MPRFRPLEALSSHALYFWVKGPEFAAISWMEGPTTQSDDKSVHWYSVTLGLPSKVSDLVSATLSWM